MKKKHGNRKTNSQFPDMGRGDMYLNTNTKWMLSRMQKVLCTLGIGNAAGARPHYIQHTWTLWSGRSLVMISSIRLNFHKFSSNARHEYIVTRRRWSTKVNTRVKSSGKLPVWGTKSHGCLGSRRRGWHRREHFESSGSTSRETHTPDAGEGFSSVLLQLFSLYVHRSAYVLPRTMSSSYSPTQYSPLGEAHSQEQVWEACAELRLDLLSTLYACICEPR